MSFIVVIPARYASQRLPGKPLLNIAGKPMLQHVYERASLSKASAVYIATDDIRIEAAAKSFGANVCMTSSAHQSGTDRIQEVTQQLGLAQSDIVVNVQGDEPLIPPQVIDQVAHNLSDNPAAGISSLCEKMDNDEDIADANAVKVVTDQNDFALYFSRSAIPWQASGSAQNAFRHIGIYAYRVAVLDQFTQWQQSYLEVQEKLEQLRALDHGVKIHVALSDVQIPPGVDTEKDLNAVRAYLDK